MLSDFTARPFVLELCEPIAGKRVLDLGCGEGYVARQLKTRGAASVHGIDISERMVELAQQAETQTPLGITFQQGDATRLGQFADHSMDLVVVFMFNYVSVEDMRRCMKEAYRVLAPGGRFVFSVPHPFFPYLKREQSAPFY